MYLYFMISGAVIDLNRIIRIINVCESLKLTIIHILSESYRTRLYGISKTLQRNGSQKVNLQSPQ